MNPQFLPGSPDAKLNEAARSLGATLDINSKKGMWPTTRYEERTLLWSENGLSYNIKFYPDLQHNEIKGWKVGAACWADKEGKRFLKNETIATYAEKDELIRNVEKDLTEAKVFLGNLVLEEL